MQSAPCGCIPYLASTRWYRTWVGAMLDGFGDMQARAAATQACGIDGKQWSRGTVASGATGEYLLTVPVTGGARILRHVGPTQVTVSDHGEWTRVHLGALEAAYGRTPFWPHIRYRLEDALQGVVPGETLLSNLAEAIHRTVCEVTGLPEVIVALRSAAAHRPDWLLSLSEWHSRDVVADRAALEAVCRKGPEAVFSLCPVKSNGHPIR